MPLGNIFWLDGWPQADPQNNNRMFNAVHMALIPKGPYQGMVIVWGIYPVDGKEPPNSGLQPLPPNYYRSFQPFAIIDPADSPASFRFRNFLLPMLGVFKPALQTPGEDGEGLFCSGHTWSPFGDLIVVGGTTFTPAFVGSRMTYALNLDHAWGPYPGVTNGWAPYADFGFWQRGPDLADRRWYPTATLTFPLTRTATGFPPRDREAVLVSGGSGVDPALLPQGTTQPTWNTLESLIVDARATATSTALIKDAIGPSTTPFTAPGPGTPGGSPDIDWFEEYPRLHMLSTGTIFFSGYAPRWASTDPDTLPIAWTKAPALPYSSNWPNPRHDAPSLLFPNFSTDDVDRVLRLGGGDVHFYFPTVTGTTETVESIQAGSPGAGWQSEPSMVITIPPVPPVTSPTAPSLGGRYLMNAVTLPNGAVFVFGGKHRSTSGLETPVYKGMEFLDGVWTSVGANGVPSIRDYHSTGVLLPDGRVFIGGGNGRNWDYEIYSPKYRTDPVLALQKPTNVVFQSPPLFDPNFDSLQLTYDTEFTVVCNALPTGVALNRAVLMAPGSITHHSDMCQRHVAMDVVGMNGNKITFRTPVDAKRAPRGIYMLFLLTTSGAVSDALWVFFA